ncbi:Citrinin biosynthesis cluster MFS transporter mrr1 [Pseudocercospora fuligena]|uniref:Citrinin biosynthesis cluster MFS transporter mrr1 n=1 Tax=Pseudocercospora fuligena TaxID=685502 RepID=A0A8H6VKN4_9PEZI|nr:Citrinin biosynthesis cluster MFS transporter mrr1 [Pseudocercospora fuligena]
MGRISIVSKEVFQSSDDAWNTSQPHQMVQEEDSSAACRSFSLETGSNAITWEGDSDPNIPRNFKRHIKCTIALTVGMMNLVVSLAVSVFTGFLPQVDQEFGYGTERMQLCLTVYILGLAFGPVFFGPASECYGRKRPLLLGMVGFVVFTTYTTFARDFGGILFCRILAGVCGSAAYVIPPGIFVDLYGPVGRAIGYQLFATGAFIGGSLGPGVGLSVAGLGDWR